MGSKSIRGGSERLAAPSFGLGVAARRRQAKGATSAMLRQLHARLPPSNLDRRYAETLRIRLEFTEETFSPQTKISMPGKKECISLLQC